MAPLSGGRTWAAWYIIHSTSDFGLARLPPRQTPIKCIALFSQTSLLGQPILEYCLDRPPVPPPVLFEKSGYYLKRPPGGRGSGVGGMSAGPGVCGPLSCIVYSKPSFASDSTCHSIFRDFYLSAIQSSSDFDFDWLNLPPEALGSGAIG